MKTIKLLLATRNEDKVKEIREVLKDLDIKIISASQIDGLPEVEEDQDTLEGNAIKKARVLAKASGLPALADDTGLEVEFLNGAPGVRSSRFAGENVTYDDNVDELLRRLQDVPPEKRKARFRTVVALAIDDHIETVEGICRGEILSERRGAGGFGYDPVFFVPEIGKTFAEMSLAEKNRISHRGVALTKMRRLLQRKLLQQ